MFNFLYYILMYFAYCKWNLHCESEKRCYPSHDRNFVSS